MIAANHRSMQRHMKCLLRLFLALLFSSLETMNFHAEPLAAHVEKFDFLLLCRVVAITMRVCGSEAGVIVTPSIAATRFQIKIN